MSSIHSETMRVVSRRLLSFLFIVFVFNQLDRANVSFAALRMNADLGFTPQVYGFGVGVFFVSYLLFEIPSNLILQRVGARIWLARIMISWGLIAMAMAFINNATWFYIARFALGVAEAGFVPGYLFYIQRWLPEQNKGVGLAKVALAIPVAVIFGAPLSGALLSLGDIAGLESWRWMFIIEGLPSVILGVAAYFVLTEGPAEARWLRPDQRDWLLGEIERGRAAKSADVETMFGAAMKDKRVWLCTVGFFWASMCTYGIVYWMPQIIQQLSGLPVFAVTVLTAIPFVGLGLGMYINTWLSDRTGERHLHFVLAVLLSAAGIGIGASVSNPVVAFCGLVVCATGIGAALGVFWLIPMAFLSGSAAAGGLALINMIGNTAGFFSPYIIGWIRQTTNSFTAGLYMVAASLLVSASLVFILRQLSRQQSRAMAPIHLKPGSS